MSSCTEERFDASKLTEGTDYRNTPETKCFSELRRLSSSEPETVPLSPSGSIGAVQLGTERQNKERNTRRFRRRIKVVRYQRSDFNLTTFSHNLKNLKYNTVGLEPRNDQRSVRLSQESEASGKHTVRDGHIDLLLPRVWIPMFDGRMTESGSNRKLEERRTVEHGCLSLWGHAVVQTCRSSTVTPQ
ncbi:hypothetical protein F2P81_020618 [Scophthalmus maximus]|uniref:Uncharacterized protein n=1 Tax=Scophthalmus maximus TaxID=52904 RepID=A0A6A4S4B0_SCOMX|nr:hypothetical protein F2P81_020618 [Scophthalmus maximus]